VEKTHFGLQNLSFFFLFSFSLTHCKFLNNKAPRTWNTSSPFSMVGRRHLENNPKHSLNRCSHSDQNINRIYFVPLFQISDLHRFFTDLHCLYDQRYLWSPLCYSLVFSKTICNSKSVLQLYLISRSKFFFLTSVWIPLY